MDDGVVAGHAVAVKAFVDCFKNEMMQIGLTINAEKSEVIPPAGSWCTVPSDSFDGFQWLTTGNFKLLGAPFGDASYCTERTTMRKVKAAKIATGARKFWPYARCHVVVTPLLQLE